MKQPQHITFSGVKKTPTSVACWALELSQLHCPSLYPAGARRRALPTSKAGSRSTECKNGW